MEIQQKEAKGTFVTLNQGLAQNEQCLVVHLIELFVFAREIKTIQFAQGYDRHQSFF